jgi:ATP-binding protein involved in chromosome partitioning
MSQADMMRQMADRQKKIIENMKKIKYKISVFSGKGGGGKSVVTANLAAAVAEQEGTGVGILDSDFTGPTIPRMMGARKEDLRVKDDWMIPPKGAAGVKVISMSFLLPEEKTPVIWRGPIKKTALEQLLGSVEWGDIDYLIFDLPPGTGDEALNIMQVLPGFDGFIVVTVPTEVSRSSVLKSIGFAKKMKARVLGVIENMSGYVCPDCGNIDEIFIGNGGELLADEMDVPLLGKIPLDRRLSETSDRGVPMIIEHPEAPASMRMKDIARKIVTSLHES